MNAANNPLFNRSTLLLGPETMELLSESKIIIFGVGGVGSWAAETLVRTGAMDLTIVDFDEVAASNVNRQVPATFTTIGESKVQAMKRHLLSINPEAAITAMETLYNPDTADSFDLGSYDYVIDAIDSLRDKALLINRATRSSTRLYSSMGAALKLDPTKIEVGEFGKVTGCRLAAALRRKFKSLGEYPARKFKTVYSPEIVENRGATDETLDGSPINKVKVNGSVMQITAIFGIMLASLVINDLAAKGKSGCSI